MGWIWVVVGLIVTAASLGADDFGIGEGTAIGYKQIIGTVVGVGITITGLRRVFRS